MNALVEKFLIPILAAVIGAAATFFIPNFLSKFHDIEATVERLPISSGFAEQLFSTNNSYFYAPQVARITIENSGEQRSKSIEVSIPHCVITWSSKADQPSLSKEACGTNRSMNIPISYLNPSEKYTIFALISDPPTAGGISVLHDGKRIFTNYIRVLDDCPYCSFSNFFDKFFLGSGMLGQYSNLFCLIGYIGTSLIIFLLILSRHPFKAWMESMYSNEQVEEFRNIVRRRDEIRNKTENTS